MANVYDVTNDEFYDLRLFYAANMDPELSGVDFTNDLIGDYYRHVAEMTDEVMQDIDRVVARDGGDRPQYAMTSADIDWWERWSAREELIQRAMEELPEDADVPDYYDRCADWSDAQDLYEEYLGIESV